MSAKKFSLSVSGGLSDSQINDLARPLGRILERFYADPENEAKFQKWMAERSSQQCLTPPKKTLSP